MSSSVVCLILFYFASFAANSAWSRSLNDLTTDDVTLPMSTFFGKDKVLYACTAIPVEPEQYIVDFKPLVKGIHYVHHMGVHLCDAPYEDAPVWDCFDTKKTCIGKTDAVYGWVDGSPGWTLPEMAGVYTGKTKKFVVLQVHGLSEGKFTTGDVGMRLAYTKIRPRFNVAMVVLGNAGYIPANIRDFTTDSSCMWNSTFEAPLINYQLHTHEHGTAVSGYIIRNNEWIEIGRGDPLYPEILYDVTHKNLDFRQGDILAARCTFDNNENRNLTMGWGDENEMCNLYLHYGIPMEIVEFTRTRGCENNIQEYTWESHLKDIPSQASDTSGDTEQNRYVIKYHVEKVGY